MIRRKSRKMGAISIGLGDCRHGNCSNHHHHQPTATATTATTTTTKSHRPGSSSGNNGAPVVVDEIEGLIRVFKDGRVERPPVMKEVLASWSPVQGVSSADVAIDSAPASRLWARVHVPTSAAAVASTVGRRLPLVVYFHGGGFCVGSPAWSCYHEFLSRLALAASCVVVSANYRLAPEHRLPAAFDDGQRAVKWIHQLLLRRDGADHNDPSAAPWWAARCDPSRVFLAGDSAGATIAHNVASRLAGAAPSSPASTGTTPCFIKGTILIQPFFGGEARTWSERCLPQPLGSALTLPASDAYWRMSLPAGATRDHPWCNPLSGVDPHHLRRLPPSLVCVAETDILRDRTGDFCRAVRRAGGSVEQVVHAGVGHAFHVLHVHGSRVAQARAHEMLAHINSFIQRSIVGADR